MAFNKNIKFLRIKRGWSQEELATRLGYKSFTTIAKWESGIAEPHLKTVKKIAKLFDVEVNELINSDLTNISPSKSYYMDEEASKVAQELFDRPEMKVLFDASKNVSKEDILYVANLLKKLQKGDDE